MGQQLAVCFRGRRDEVLKLALSYRWWAELIIRLNFLNQKKLAQLSNKGSLLAVLDSEHC